MVPLLVETRTMIVRSLLVKLIARLVPEGSLTGATIVPAPEKAAVAPFAR
jgi:hypothetical protein